jgi:hypothetical protein
MGNTGKLYAVGVCERHKADLDAEKATRVIP